MWKEETATMKRKGMDQLEELGFEQLKPSTTEIQDMPKWGMVNVHLVTADGRMPDNAGAMHWRVSSWPISKTSARKATWEHLIDRVRGGGIA